MKQEELHLMVEKAQNGSGDINDAIQIIAAMFESTSKHLKEIKSNQSSILSKIEELKSRIDKIEEHTVDWVFRAVVED